MIIDVIENLGRYQLPFAREIAGFIKSGDPRVDHVTEIEISGRSLFVRPSAYRTRSVDVGRFETHECYADLQYVVSGAEVMQVVPAGELTLLTPYDPVADIAFYAARENITDILVTAGQFSVFFPGEAHRPMCHPPAGPGDVIKLVFKIKYGA